MSSIRIVLKDTNIRPFLRCIRQRIIPNQITRRMILSMDVVGSQGAGNVVEVSLL